MIPVDYQFCFPCEITTVLPDYRLELRLDLGFGLSLVDHFRLVGIQFPDEAIEVERAKAARAFVVMWGINHRAILCDVTRSKTGEYLVDLSAPIGYPEPPDNLAYDLVGRGLAEHKVERG